MAACINRCGNTLFMDFQCRNLERQNLLFLKKVKFAIFGRSFASLRQNSVLSSEVTICISILTTFLDACSYLSNRASIYGYVHLFIDAAVSIYRWPHLFIDAAASIYRWTHLFIDAAAAIYRCSHIYL